MNPPVSAASSQTPRNPPVSAAPSQFPGIPQSKPSVLPAPFDQGAKTRNQDGYQEMWQTLRNRTKSRRSFVRDEPASNCCRSAHQITVPVSALSILPYTAEHRRHRQTPCLSLWERWPSAARTERASSGLSPHELILRIMNCRRWRHWALLSLPQSGGQAASQLPRQREPRVTRGHSGAKRSPVFHWVRNTGRHI